VENDAAGSVFTMTVQLLSGGGLQSFERSLNSLSQVHARLCALPQTQEREDSDDYDDEADDVDDVAHGVSYRNAITNVAWVRAVPHGRTGSGKLAFSQARRTRL
jgi:hypothetical protein